MKSLSILVVDDEKDIRILMQQWLTESGHAVVAAASGTAASDAMKQRQFDLVVTDVLMPDGDGVDLINEVRTMQPATRILAISGGGRYTEGSDYLVLAKGIGAHAAVLKPFTRQQLEQGMEAAIAAQLNREW